MRGVALLLRLSDSVARGDPDIAQEVVHPEGGPSQKRMRMLHDDFLGRSRHFDSSINFSHCWRNDGLSLNNAAIDKRKPVASMKYSAWINGP